MPLPCMTPDPYIGKGAYWLQRERILKTNKKFCYCLPSGSCKDWPLFTAQDIKKGDSYKAQGNKKTYQAAKEAALYVADSLIIMPDPMLPEKPEYSTQDNKDTASFMNTRVKMGEGIQQTNDSLYQLHWLSPQSTNSQGTHLGQRKLKELLRHLRFKIFNMDKLLEDCVTKCLSCQATNPQKKDCWLCLDPRPLFT